MSEQTNEPVKQEGDFKIKSKKKTPKKLVNTDEITKVNIKEPLIDLPPEIRRGCHSNRRNKGNGYGRTSRR